MGRYRSFVHGTALTVESPDALVENGRFGYGADVVFRPGEGSWFHIPLPVPARLDGAPVVLEQVYLLFSCETFRLDSVHVWDGATRIQEFDLASVAATGDLRTRLVSGNTFVLNPVRTVSFGIGLSFFAVAPVRTGPGQGEPPPPRLIVAGAGAEYDTGRTNLQPFTGLRDWIRRFLKT